MIASVQPQADLIAAMLDPGFYPDRPERVELRETHSSWVFLAGELAYKVKKPVVFPFLDYGTPERRLEMCREEVRLNRRLAPDYYLGVEAIVARDGGYALAPVDDPEAVEYTVRMRRVPEQRTMERLVEVGELAPDDVDAVGRRLASFHHGADPAPPPSRGVAPFRASVRENVKTLRDVGPATIPGPRLRAMAEFSNAFLTARDDELRRRAKEGRIRDCHGDLRAEHVIVTDPVAIYDCIEFNPDFRFIDVGLDLSFLVMDLSRLGAEPLADRLVASYREAGGDPGDDALLSFFAAYRAWVRAKLSCIRAGQLSEGPEHDAAQGDARALMALGHRFAWRARRPLVVVVCGVAASGKTRLARELAEISGLPHLSSDVIRKELAGLAPTERAAPEHYTGRFNRRTYAKLESRTVQALKQARGAIVDATFIRRSSRAALREVLGGVAPVFFVECQAPVEVLRERADRRERGPGQASDADWAIVERQLKRFEPLDEIPPASRLATPTDRPIGETIADLERRLNATALLRSPAPPA
jgi:aminoglycoside phosphotransferase family enzyme/predicted kinase